MKKQNKLHFILRAALLDLKSETHQTNFLSAEFPFICFVTAPDLLLFACDIDTGNGKSKKNCQLLLPK